MVDGPKTEVETVVLLHHRHRVHYAKAATSRPMQSLITGLSQYTFAHKIEKFFSAESQ
jgi:hypothetical protein